MLLLGQGGEVEGDVLLGDKPRSYPSAQVFFQECRDGLGRNVSPALEESTSQDGDRVGVGLDEVCEAVCEAGFLVEGGDAAVEEGEKCF